VHRKKVPTRNLDIPEEVRLAKKVKNVIGIKASVVGGDEYDMMLNHCVANEEFDEEEATLSAGALAINIPG